MLEGVSRHSRRINQSKHRYIVSTGTGIGRNWGGGQKTFTKILKVPPRLTSFPKCIEHQYLFWQFNIKRLTHLTNDYKQSE